MGLRGAMAAQNMIVKEIFFSSAEYEGAKRVREEALRLPLGMRLSPRDVEGEREQIHFAALDERGSVVGTVILKPLSAGLVKLRQMAVAPSLQKSGIGRKLVELALQTARARDFKVMELHSRMSARGFYEKLGFKAEGEVFTESTLPHVKMTLNLPHR